MKGSRLSIFWSILLGGILPLVLVFILQCLPEWKWLHEPFHSGLEALGVFAGISIAIILLFQQEQQKDTSHYAWIASGLIGMGVLDGFHACVRSGNNFVWLHSISVLVGSLLFSMAWIPLRNAPKAVGKIIVTLVTVVITAIGVLSLVFPERVPLMVVDGNFTFVTLVTHMMVGFLFLLAAVLFLARYWKEKEVEDILFVFFCLLNASAAVTFVFGHPWTVDWWLWHLLRLVAYVIMLGYIFHVFSDLTERQRILQQVKEAINVLASSSSEIMAATCLVTAGATETATAISETTTTVEEVKQAALLSTQKARYVSESAQKTAQVAQNGKKSVETMKEGMNHIREQMETIAETIVKLSEQSQAIGEIMATVNDIAEQSNLLAVNAAIEAAKAGGEGKGFAVVAQEIKSLAEQSKQATAQVRGILRDVQKGIGASVMVTEQGSKAVETGVKQSNGAEDAIRLLAESLAEAAHAATQIAASSQQQLAGMEQIALAMENIKQASAGNVASSKQTETSAHNLHGVGQKLQEMVEGRREGEKEWGARKNS